MNQAPLADELAIEDGADSTQTPKRRRTSPIAGSLAGSIVPFQRTGRLVDHHVGQRSS